MVLGMEVSRKVEKKKKKRQLAVPCLPHKSCNSQRSGRARSKGGRRDEGKPWGRDTQPPGLGLGLGWDKRQQTGRGTEKRHVPAAPES